MGSCISFYARWFMDGLNTYSESLTLNSEHAYGNYEMLNITTSFENYESGDELIYHFHIPHFDV